MAGLAVIILVGVMMVASVLIMLARLGIRKFLGYPNLFDIAFGILMVAVFHGTYTGMVAAGAASLIMSAVLVCLRSTMGAERLCVSVSFKSRGAFKVRKPWVKHDALDPDRSHWHYKGFPIPCITAFWVRLTPAEL